MYSIQKHMFLTVPKLINCIKTHPEKSGCVFLNINANLSFYLITVFVNYTVIIREPFKLNQFVRWVHMNFTGFVHVCSKAAEGNESDNVQHDDTH